MTKREIVKKISEQVGLTQRTTSELVQKTIDVIMDTLIAEGRVELRNFGVFEIREHGPREYRNPQTGEKLTSPGKFAVSFKPGKHLDARIQKIKKREPKQINDVDDASNSDSPQIPPVDDD